MMSGDASAEVSVPTDLTVTSDGESEDGFAASRRHARELQALASDRAELQRTVEKQRLELQNKKAQIAAITAQNESAVASAIAQKDDIISAKQIQANRLEAELVRTREELSTIKERAARELAQLAQKCATFQETQKKLTFRHEELRSSLTNLQISESEYNRLRRVSAQQLTLQQFTALRVYELVWPLKIKVNELETVKSSLESSLAAKDLDLKARSDQCRKQQQELEDLRSKSEHYASQLLNLKEEQRSDDYKARNYHRVKSERDQLEGERETLTRKSTELELLVATLKKERSLLEERFGELKVKTRKQEHDIDEQQEQISDLKSKLERTSEELSSTCKNLRIERDRNADLHEKYISMRGEVTSLAENSNDYQHEIRVLREKLQSSNSHCNSLQEDINQLTQKNDYLSVELEKYKARYETEVDKLDTEVKELRQSISSLSKSRDVLAEENAKLHQDIESARKALQEDKSSKDREVLAVTEELNRVKNILKGYQSLEAEYEKTIRTAATLSEEEANRLLDRMPSGVGVVGSRALNQSIQLTRRVLELERQNTDACTTIQQLSKALDQLKNTIASYKSALSLAGQPSASLLQRIASQEDQIISLQDALQHNSLLQSTLEEENKTLIRDITKLKQEVERMAFNAGEISAIKQQLQLLQQSMPQVQQTAPSTSSQIIHDHRRFEPPTPAESKKPLNPAKAIIITKDKRTRS